MNSRTHHYNFLDENGNPEGGQAFGNGFAIAWQRGPLGRGEDRIDPNGAFVEDIIRVAKERIEFYNDNGFACDENYNAVAALNDALANLTNRTLRRESQGVEGTHKGS